MEARNNTNMIRNHPSMCLSLALRSTNKSDGVIVFVWNDDYYSNWAMTEYNQIELIIGNPKIQG